MSLYCPTVGKFAANTTATGSSKKKKKKYTQTGHVHAFISFMQKYKQKEQNLLGLRHISFTIWLNL